MLVCWVDRFHRSLQFFQFLHLLSATHYVEVICIQEIMNFVNQKITVQIFDTVINKRKIQISPVVSFNIITVFSVNPSITSVPTPSSWSWDGKI